MYKNIYIYIYIYEYVGIYRNMKECVYIFVCNNI